MAMGSISHTMNETPMTHASTSSGACWPASPSETAKPLALPLTERRPVPADDIAWAGGVCCTAGDARSARCRRVDRL